MGPVVDRIRHSLSPEGHQLDGLLRGEDAGGAQGGVLAQAQPGRHGGTDALFIEHSGDTGSEGHHTGLGVLGLAELLLRALEAQLLEVEVHPGAVQHRPEGGIGLIEVLAHAHMLGALTGIEKGQLHQKTSFSMRSRTPRQPLHRSSRMARTGRISWSIPAT